MPRFALAYLLLLLSSDVIAENLCDAACTLTISFPSGGSVEAVEPVEFKFGDGGLVDTAGSVTAYVKDETLVLAAGGNITFGVGGYFDLGNAGNLDYTNFRIVTDGVMHLAPATGADSITFPENSTLSMSADSTLLLSGVILNLGSLEVGRLVLLTAFENPADPPECELLTATDNSLSITGGTIATTDSTALLATSQLPDCDLDAVISPPLVTLNANTLQGFGGTLTPANISIDMSSPELVPLESNESSPSEEENASAVDRATLLVLLLLAWLACLRKTKIGVT